jgi:predicted ABC-type transport system involved in lysophospholipase L1 biosynthesis ATPase subunit
VATQTRGVSRPPVPHGVGSFTLRRLGSSRLLLGTVFAAVLISSAVAGVLVTLGLRTLPGLDRPTTDSVHIGGQDVTAMTEHERLLMRRTGVSFIFQSFGLIPMLSAAENVGVPLRIAGLDYRGREERVAQMLAVVDLTEHARQRPNELSAAGSSESRSPAPWRSVRIC